MSRGDGASSDLSYVPLVDGVEIAAAQVSGSCTLPAGTALLIGNCPAGSFLLPITVPFVSGATGTLTSEVQITIGAGDLASWVGGFTLRDAAVVPEPGTILLMVAALAVISWLRLASRVKAPGTMHTR